MNPVISSSYLASLGSVSPVVGVASPIAEAPSSLTAVSGSNIAAKPLAEALRKERRVRPAGIAILVVEREPFRIAPNLPRRTALSAAGRRRRILRCLGGFVLLQHFHEVPIRV